ncbi:trypsin-like peptidase domain-containing protein [Bifidobacterium aquikefiri]|uniref:S1C family serine protease n=1 Tax=Bifidobacterium aquikefiri TaxID=1653207 RepID=UPI0039E7C8E3
MAEDEHKIHPWEGDGDDQSWQPSHIDSHDTTNNDDSTDNVSNDAVNDSENTGPLNNGTAADGTEENHDFISSNDTKTESFNEPLTQPIDTNHDSSAQETQQLDPASSNDYPTTQIPNGDNDWLNAGSYGSSTGVDGNPFVSHVQNGNPQNDNARNDDMQKDYDDPGQTRNLSSVADEDTNDSGSPTETLPASADQSSSTQPDYASQQGYRPAPEYGAFAPGYNQQRDATQQGKPEYGASYQGQFNPYPYGGPEQAQDSQQSNQPDQQSQQTQQNPQYVSQYGSEYPQGSQSQQNPQTPGPQYPQGPQGPQYPFGPQFNPQNGPTGPNRRNAKADSRNKPINTILVAIIAALVSAALMLGLGWAAISNGLVTLPTSASISSLDSSTSGSGSATAKSGEAPDWQAVEKQVSSSVVSIETTVSDGVDMGSGAIIDTDGDIVTNNHVITGATKIQVTLSNGQIYSAKTVGTDSTTDLAVIKLENPPSNLKAVTFADSDSVAVGENIMAIGNPLGYDNTATTGIVSALNRPVSVMDDTSTTIVTNAIQIDAAINPGNSGGPTFNAAGQVVGINSSIASTATSSSTAGSIGIGFAIPSNLVKRVSQEIIKDGSVKHVALGISIQSATVESDGVTRGGAKIVSVTSGSPAAKAGLKTGDVIVGYDGNAVNSNYSVLGFVRASAYGAKATITVVRNGSTQNVSVTLDQEESAVTGKSKTDSDSDSGSGSGSSDGNSDNDNGLTDPFGLLEGN